MLVDYLDDRVGESLLLSELYAVLRVLCDYRNTLHYGQAVVRVNSAVLILCEILRVFELSDIVIICCNFTEQRVCSDCFSCGVCKICNHH